MPAHSGQDHARDVVAANLRALKGYADQSDSVIAIGMGRTRSWVNERMSGATECKVTDLAAFADYFGVSIQELCEPRALAGSYPFDAAGREKRRSLYPNADNPRSVRIHTIRTHASHWPLVPQAA